MSAEATSTGPLPRILIVDHFDSYTLNLLSLLSQVLSPSSTLGESSKDVKGKRRSHNGESAVDRTLDSNVVVLPHTHALLASEEVIRSQLLPSFDAIILSPGPGSPHDESDFGAGRRLLRMQEAAAQRGERPVPILGVCLGHQGIATAFGGKVRRAKAIRHGVTSTVKWAIRGAGAGTTGTGLYDGLEDGFNVVRYNSLTVDSKGLPDCLEVIAWAVDPPNPYPSPHAATRFPVQPPSRSVTPITTPAMSRSSSYEAVAPLSVQALKSFTASRTGEEVVMALQHRSLPIWGVQFHPESIESEMGVELLRNWLSLVSAHYSSEMQARPAVSPALRMEGRRCVAGPREDAKRVQTRPLTMLREHVRCHDALPGQLELLFEQHFLEHDGIWLDSARKWDPHSRFSYMALPALWLSYSAATRSVTVSNRGAASQPKSYNLQPGETWWSVVQDLHQGLAGGVADATLDEADSGEKLHRFCSGLIGYFGYEMNEEPYTGPDGKLNGTATADASRVSDSEVALCPRVLAYDHHTNTASIFAFSFDGRASEPECDRTSDTLLGLLQSETFQQTQGWLQQLAAVLQKPLQHSAISQHEPLTMPPMTSDDSQARYIDKVEACRAHIAAGESYELCLTTQFRGTLSPDLRGDRESHYHIYKGLRARNAAPYSCYLPLPDLPDEPPVRTICSTSPERFMRATASGVLEMKPIKGTVARAGFGFDEAKWKAVKCACPDDAHKATCPEPAKTFWREQEDAKRCAALAADIKERAENLMIVDLIRADLLAMCRPSSVIVPALMKIESYASVHQLVTTVQGELKDGVGVVEALARSFPPGSMTGAPKKRSVELLRKIESVDREGKQGKNGGRGVYSGILGWIGLDGAADFSVVIRTATLSGRDVTLGAGGAVTYASDPAAEWKEVLFKAKALVSVEL